MSPPAPSVSSSGWGATTTRGPAGGDHTGGSRAAQKHSGVPGIDVSNAPLSPTTWFMCLYSTLLLDFTEHVPCRVVEARRIAPTLVFQLFTLNVVHCEPMNTQFTRAIVRKPGATYADGLTTAAAGAPELPKALRQHDLYVDALRRCGLTVTIAETDDRYPDGTFVEDTAVISGRMAVVTWPGAPTRQGEITSIEAALRSYDLELHRITSPGTV